MKRGKRTETYYAIARMSGKLSGDRTDLCGPFYHLDEVEAYQRDMGGHLVRVTKTETWEPVKICSPNKLS